MTVHNKPTTCPWCNTRHPAASNVDKDFHHAPKPGHVTLCIDCGRWSVFRKDGSLRKPTPNELRAYTDNPEMRRVWAAWFYTTKANMAQPLH